MMRSSLSALGAPYFTRVFVIQALCLSSLLVHGNSETANTETTGTATALGSSRAADEPCTTSLVHVGSNLSVVAQCTCEEADMYDYDAFVVYTANASGLFEMPPAPNHSGSRRSWVEDGTPCLLSERASIGGKSIDVGVCLNGSCSDDNKTTYRLTTTPRPAYDPYQYHCKVSMSALNSKLRVASRCVARCFVWEKRSWVNNAVLNDGRLCDLVKASGDDQYLKRSGVCRNGACVSAVLPHQHKRPHISDCRLCHSLDWRPWSHPCKMKYVRRNGIILAEKCTVYCKNNKKAKVRDGTRCLLNYERRVKVRGVDDIIVDGICKHGYCIITPPTVPMLMVDVPEEGCKHFLASVNYTHRVESSCSALCFGRERYKAVQPGTPCALKTSGTWQTVTEVGECVHGGCLAKDRMETPPPHEQVDPTLQNCRDKNYVIVDPGRLTVVASCQVECNYGRVEKRKDGVSCLLEYRATKRGEKTYTVGVCKRGHCTLGRHPRNITTQD